MPRQVDTSEMKQVSKELASMTPERKQDIITKYIVDGGDLSYVTPTELAVIYLSVCDAYNVPAAVHPFDLIKNRQTGKLNLYANKNCATALGQNHQVSIVKSEQDQVGDNFTIMHFLQDRDGRTGVGFAAVSTRGMVGDNLSNLLMKCDTKAYRRGILRMYGIGMNDESELDTMKNFDAKQVKLPKLSEKVAAKKPARKPARKTTKA